MHDLIPTTQSLKDCPLLGQGATGLVYLIRNGQSQFALKILRRELLEKDSTAAERFRREGQILSRLHDDGIVHVFETGERDGLPYILMEVAEGEPLTRLIERGALAEDRVLAIGRMLAQALKEIHRYNFLHQDLKPDNIIISPNGKSKIIDFGFAREISASEFQERLGTPQYCSPEQLGLIPDSVGPQSDLYALGLILYECATGTPCWTSADLGQIIKEQSGPRVPADKKNPSLSPVISKMITKLLALNPSDRYQTAEGLLSDLNSFDAFHADFKAGKSLLLGQFDYRILSGSELPLIGREVELQTLLGHFTHLEKGRGSSVLVEGDPGSGKSFLVQKAVLARGQPTSLYLSAKCQLSEQTPFAAIRDCLVKHIRILHGLPAGDPKVQNFRSAVKGCEQAIAKLCDNFRSFWQDDFAEVALDREQLMERLVQLFLNLNDGDNKMILFIDDVQWADPGTLTVLRRIQEALTQRAILVILAARTDVGKQPATVKILSEMAESGMKRIELKSLSFAETTTLVETQLNGGKVSNDLIYKLYTQVAGNPFAVSQFLYALLDARVLRKNSEAWLVDMGKFDQIVLGGNVIAILVGRLNQLKQSTQEALAAAAVLGGAFQTQSLSQVLQRQAISSINEALAANLIEQDEFGDFKISHDRIREALLSTLDSEQQQILHQRIGEAMMDGRIRGDDFAIAHHLYLGFRNRNPRQTFDVNLKVSVSSLKTHAASNSVELFERTESVAHEFKLELALEEKITLQENFGIALWRNGNGKKAVQYLGQVIELSKDPLTLGRIHFMMGQAYFNENQGLQGLNEVERGLASLGLTLPQGPFLQFVSTLWWWIRVGLRKLSPRRPQDPVSLERHRVLVSLLSTGCYASFVGLKWPATQQLIPRMLYYAIPLEGRPESVEPLSFYVMYLGLKGRARKLEALGKTVLQTAIDSKNRELIGLARLRYGLALHWAGNATAAATFQQGTIDDYANWIAPRWLVVNCNDMAGANLLVRGFAREALAVAQKSLGRGLRTESLSVKAVTSSVALGPHSVLGNEQDRDQLLESLSTTYKDIPATSLDWCWNLSHRVLDCMEHDEEFPDFANTVREFWKRVPAGTCPMFFKPFFLYSAFYAVNRFCRSEGGQSPTDPELTNGCLVRLKQATPVPHWRIIYWYLLSLTLEKQGKFIRSRIAFFRAQLLRSKAESPWAHFLLDSETARRKLSQGLRSSAQQYVIAARAIARGSGWQNRLKALETEFQGLLDGEKSGDHPEASAQVETQLSAVVRISKFLNESSDLNEFSKKALNELCTLFNAEKALLIVKGRLGRPEVQCSFVPGQDTPARVTFSSSVVDRVFNSKAYAIFTGTEESDVQASHSIVIQNLKSIVAAPLLTSNSIFGVIYLDSRFDRATFSTDNAKLLTAICSHIGLLFERARTQEKLQSLLQIGMTTASFADPVDHARKILDEVVRLMNAQRASLFVETSPISQLRVGFGRTDAREDIVDFSEFSTSIIEAAKKQRKPVVEFLNGQSNSAKSMVLNDLKVAAAAPLVIADKVIGVLYLDSRADLGGTSAIDTILLSSIAGHLALVVEMARAAHLELEKLEMAKDLEVSGAVQSLLLPRIDPIHHDGVELSSFYLPAAKVGGDWWWHAKLDEHRHVIFVGDVTGHGPGAAMVTCVLATSFRFQILEQIKNEGSRAALSCLDRTLFEMCREEYLISAGLLIVDTQGHTLEFWSAGCPPLLHLIPGKNVQTLDVSGSLLGSGHGQFDNIQHPYAPGDQVHFVTDGAYELHTETGGELGVRRLGKIIHAAAVTAGPELAKTIGSQILTAAGSKKPQDDITIVSLVFGS